MHRSMPRFIARAVRSKSTASLEQDALPLVHRTPIAPVPTAPRTLPLHRPDEWYPPYAKTGHVSPPFPNIYIPNHQTIDKLRTSGQLARRVLELACASAAPGRTTDEIDAVVYDALIASGAYPSPLNYMGFPKSVCSSINEVICHGIPDGRKLEYGDIVSFDVSCYLDGVHGDNCGTVIVGDTGDSKQTNWLGERQRTEFATPACEEHFETCRRLVQATIECLDAGISTVKTGSCMSEIGAACQDVAEQYGFSSVSQYRGHGIGEQFHTAPFISHVRNTQTMKLETDMVFTIEPMLCQHSAECYEWDSDGWTVATRDGGLAAQFEHMIRVTEHGAEILTVS